MTKRHYSIALLSALLVALLFSACGNKDSIVIKGTLANGAGKTIYFEEMSPQGKIFLDSIKLDKGGSFSFKYKIPYKTFIDMHVNDVDYVVLLPDYGEKIKITADYNDFKNSYQLTGSPESLLLWQLQDYSNKGDQTLKEIVAIDQKNRELLNNGELSQNEYDIEHKVTDSLYLDAFMDQQKYIVDFIQEHLGSLATIIAVYKPFNNHPLVDPSNSFEFYEAVVEGLKETLPDNPHTVNLENQVKRLGFMYANQ